MSGTTRWRAAGIALRWITEVVIVGIALLWIAFAFDLLAGPPVTLWLEYWLVLSGLAGTLGLVGAFGLAALPLLIWSRRWFW